MHLKEFLTLLRNVDFKYIFIIKALFSFQAYQRNLKLKLYFIHFFIVEQIFLLRKNFILMDLI